MLQPTKMVQHCHLEPFSHTGRSKSFDVACLTRVANTYNEKHQYGRKFLIKTVSDQKLDGKEGWQQR